MEIGTSSREVALENLISCRPESFGPFADRAFESLPRLGIKYVEIPVPEPDKVEATARQLEEHGLKAYSVGYYHKVQEPDFLEKTAAAVDAAASLGAGIIFTSQHTDGRPRSEVHDRMRQAGDIAAKSNVVLAMETHPDLCQNGKLAVETMEGINHPNVRVNFDPANVHYYNENVDALEELKQVVQYVAAVHLKDSNGGYKQWHFPAIGEGVVNWKGIFEVMNGRGMHGPFTLEMEGIEGEDLTYEKAYRRIEQSLEYLRAGGMIA